jgi:tetratricopeptide (TPR) repeat protein
MIPQDLTTEVVKTAIQLVVENAFKYGLPAAKRTWEQTRKGNVGKTPAFALKGNLINRESALRAIRNALGARNNTRVIYLYGSGGAGKTRLLEEGRNLAKSNSSLRWAGIFDLYHTDLHNILRLQTAITENLDSGGQHFSKYREAKELFENRRREGIFSASSETVVWAEIAYINQLFIEEFNQYTSEYRTVLAFDTLENVGEEQDLIQRIFGLGEGRESLSIRQWLLDLCMGAVNAVILLAGRPHEDLKYDLEKINQDHIGRVESILVDGLTQSDTADLLKVYTRKPPRPIADLLARNAVMIWQATKGLPVHVALLVELVLQSPDVFGNEMGKNNPELGRGIVRAFFDGENPDRRHFFFLALARKGLTPDLLRFLEQGWTEEECARRLNAAESSTLTKMRHGETELFLHDALYEMFDGFTPYLEEEKVYWFQRLQEYYQKLKPSAKGSRSLWKKSIINILYYDLRCDFSRAFYQNFTRWSEIAIKGYEMELDSQLRNEVLVYMRNDSKHKSIKDSDDIETVFIQDSATRWIKRLIRQAQYDQAIKLAKTLFAFEPTKAFSSSALPPVIGISEERTSKLKSSITAAHPVFWASLRTYYGESLIYSATEPENQIEKIFQHALRELDDSQIGQDQSLWWLWNRLSGYVYDRLGYLARANGHYRNAAEYYRQAIPFYKEADVVDEFAFTQNNLAFVLALLGDMPGAKFAAEDALAKRLELGQRYPIALSYNTRGLIRALENPSGLDGQRDCEKALSIFEEINTPRGIGLACNALGFILRKRGEGWTSVRCTTEQAKQWYAKSEECFERAKEVFKDGEKIRLWESLNELGCLNRDWARLFKSFQDEESARTRFAQALDFHRQALKLAQENNMRFQQVDALDDISELYLDLGDFEQARENLEACKTLMPPEFNLSDAIIESHPGEVYWLSLAKIQMREGMTKIQMARQSASQDMLQVADGIRCILSSFVYFRLFSELPTYLEQKVREIVAILKELDIPGGLVSDAFRQIIEKYDFNLSALRLALSKEYTYEKFS